MQVKPGVEDFRRVFEYSDGALYWRHSKGSAKAGERAGHIRPSGKNSKSPYEFVQVDGKTLGTHRVVFAMHSGFMPEFVDHIDGDPLNNRVENLRAATKSENCCNRGKQITNSSGYKGVYFDVAKNKWRAEIVKDGKRSRLGHFLTPKEASEAYQKAAIEIHGEFAFVEDQPAESEISPAPAGPAPSPLDRNTAGAAGVVEPPKPAQTQAEARSDEILVEELFDLEIQEVDDDSDDFAFPRSRRIVCSASSDGQVTIHRRGDIGIALTAEEARTVHAFLDDSMPIWSRAAK